MIFHSLKITIKSITLTITLLIINTLFLPKNLFSQSDVAIANYKDSIAIIDLKPSKDKLFHYAFFLQNLSREYSMEATSYSLGTVCTVLDTTGKVVGETRIEEAPNFLYVPINHNYVEQREKLYYLVLPHLIPQKEDAPTGWYQFYWEKNNLKFHLKDAILENLSIRSDTIRFFYDSKEEYKYNEIPCDKEGIKIGFSVTSANNYYIRNISSEDLMLGKNNIQLHFTIYDQYWKAYDVTNEVFDDSKVIEIKANAHTLINAAIKKNLKEVVTEVEEKYGIQIVNGKITYLGLGRSQKCLLKIRGW